LHRLPEQMVEEYEQVKQYDILNQQSVANCGRTLNVSLSQMEGTAHPAIIAHARRWGMEHTLATMFLELPLNLYTAFCVYRQPTSRPYSERERRITERVVPHIVQAWHLNEVHFLEAPASPPQALPRARALIDRFGVLHNAEPGLPALLRCEVSDWQGPHVPSGMLAALRDRAREFKGRAVVVSVVRELPDRRWLISARARAAIDALTQREMTVARLFAAGKTHKDIARALNTSPATVRTQIQTIYLKLGVRTKIDLATHVAYAS
jgi:DNA-binding CsgD family transcriptional regulator